MNHADERSHETEKKKEEEGNIEATPQVDEVASKETSNILQTTANMTGLSGGHDSATREGRSFEPRSGIANPLGPSRKSKKMRKRNLQQVVDNAPWRQQLDNNGRVELNKQLCNTNKLKLNLFLFGLISH